jgi:hypothetical protein
VVVGEGEGSGACLVAGSGKGGARTSHSWTVEMRFGSREEVGWMWRHDWR